MASNLYIKFEDPAVTGEATETRHKNDVECLSWSHSFNQPVKPTRSTAGGGTVEFANHSDFSLTKYVDAATDDLLKACWNGKQFGKATFSAYRADGNNEPVEYLKVELEKVVISNVSFGGGGGDLPTETVSLAYGKVTYTYKPQKVSDGTADGVQPVYHDLIGKDVG